MPYSIAHARAIIKHNPQIATHTNDMKTARKIFKITSLVLSITIILIILGGVLWAYLVTKDVNLGQNGLNLSVNNLVITDSRGEEIYFDSKLVRGVDYAEISPAVINAFVALEDKRFYKHNGLDYIRIASAGINNIKAGYFKEGGSTITQQLAKNVMLTHEKTINRKLEEAKLAMQIESRYTKEEIITMYLNTIYFGHSLYGIASASDRLFGKKPIELTVSESALLAGIVKNPLKNSPLNSVDNAIARRNIVLKLMFEQDYITESEYESALGEEYSAPEAREKSTINNSYPYAVIDEAAKILGISDKELITGGYRIETYCNSEFQSIITDICANDNLRVSSEEHIVMLADNATHGITAYCSGVAESPFTFRRQPASIIKPIIAYAPALERGLCSPGSPILDERCDFDGYSPKNYQNQYSGWMTIRDALIKSANVPAVKLVNTIGLGNAQKLACDFGLTFDARDGLASALGGMTYGVTPIEITEAYATIANGGMHADLTFVKSIGDKNGNVVYTHNARGKRVVSGETAYLLTDMLKDSVKYGTSRKLSAFKYELCAKTGTNGTDKGNFDAWNMSYTSDYVMCVWYGSRDLSSPMPSSVTGGSYPTLMAKCIYDNIGIAPDNFSIPEGIITADIDSYASERSHVLQLAGKNTPEYYRKTEIINVKFAPEVSEYFDNALPMDFSVKYIDNEVIVTLTASEKFTYKVSEAKEGVIIEVPGGAGYVEFALPASFGLKSYVVTAYTADGVKITESAPRYVIIW